MAMKQGFTVFGGGIIGLTVVFNTILQATGEDTTATTRNAKWRAKEASYKKSQNMDPIGLGLRKIHNPDYLK